MEKDVIVIYHNFDSNSHYDCEIHVCIRCINPYSIKGEYILCCELYGDVAILNVTCKDFHNSKPLVKGLFSINDQCCNADDIVHQFVDKILNIKDNVIEYIAL